MALSSWRCVHGPMLRTLEAYALDWACTLRCARCRCPSLERSCALRSRPFLVLGVLAGVVLSAVTVVGVAVDQWVVAATGASMLLSVSLLVQLDAWRRLRALQRELRRSPAAGAVRAPVADGDVAGAVRVMQAQYTGRLDRMQAALDRTLVELEDRRNAVRDERDGPGFPRPDDRASPPVGGTPPPFTP
jgi:hypothetical protein